MTTRWMIAAVMAAGSAVAHAQTQTKVELPAVPSFTLPAAEQGTQDVKTLRLRGKALHGQNMRVRGYVTWVFDCKAAIGKPTLSDRRLKKLTDKDPNLCGKQRLRIAADKDASESRSILVVEDGPPVPATKLGDYVSITGTWKPSERGEVGQLAFASLAAAQPAEPQRASVTRDVEPPVVVPKAPAAKPVDPAARAKSLEHVVRGNKSLTAGKLDDAIAAYRDATTAWADNHTAWYALGVAHQRKRDWAGARTAWERAVALQPASALYQQWFGIATYEASPDKRDAASKSLRVAIALDDRSWRAAYVLGRIYRDAERPEPAAMAWTGAIKANPREPGPYIALAELYRRWDFLDEAIAVATQGLAQANDAELWYVLGNAHEDKKQDDKAVEAFSKSLELRADNHKARYARGRLLHRKGDRVKAKQDLDEFIKSAGAELAAHKQHASELAK